MLLFGERKRSPSCCLQREQGGGCRGRGEVRLLLVEEERRRLLGLRRQPLEAAAGGTQGGKGEERERGKEEDV